MRPFSQPTLRQRKWAALLAGLCLLLQPLPALPSQAESVPTGTIRIRVEGIRSAQQGDLVVALFQGEAGWPKHAKALASRTVAVLAETMSVDFPGLAYSDAYAIQVFHDRNRNGKLDFRWLPYPKPAEGAGVSNNHQRFGPPDFAKARFTLDRPLVKLDIQLRY